MAVTEQGAADSPARRRPRAAFVAVAGVAGGALLGLGAVSMGGFIFLLPAAAVVLGLTFWRAGLRALPWVVLGVALVPLWVAWDNRGGPGERCTRLPDGIACRELHDPTPWLTAAVVVLAAAAVLFGAAALLRRNNAEQHAGAG